ncbi:MAG: sigma-70 family RNA polymerase sigma factor [bacterium]|nr:sigma-70 family RNA polymerase sigma factor [bacterium]
MNQPEADLEDTPEPPPLDDSDLLRRIADHDQSALAELYDRYSGLLLALSRRVVGDSSDAEEILQEVFLQVWNQAGRYDGSRSSVSTWLVLITRSRSIDRLRSRQVKDRTLTALKQEKRDEHTSPVGVGSVLLDQRRQRLRRVMQALPTEQRQVLELAFFRGMTQSEIAGSTGIPLGTVKTRTLLAMKKLRRSLQPEIRELL